MPYSSYEEVQSERSYVTPKIVTTPPYKPVERSTLPLNSLLSPLPDDRCYQEKLMDMNAKNILQGILEGDAECDHDYGYYFGDKRVFDDKTQKIWTEYGPICKCCGEIVWDLMQT